MNSQYKKLLFFFSFVFFSMQQTVKSQELHIGDHTKDMVIRHIINYPKTTATLKDFRAELTIIDFWTTNCSGCVESFPHMDAMQKKYGQKISILFVTRQPQSIILDFFKHHKNIHLPDLPFVTGDSVLSAWFPYGSVPHHVWLDSTGRVVAITSDWNATTRTYRFLYEKWQHHPQG